MHNQPLLPDSFPPLRGSKPACEPGGKLASSLGGSPSRALSTRQPLPDRHFRQGMLELVLGFADNERHLFRLTDHPEML